MIQIGKQKRKVLFYLLTVMLMTTMTTIAFAASLSDIANHWAKDQILAWADKGFVKGYPDGTFKPDNNVSRSEFMALVNGAFGYTDKAAIDYKDVPAGIWYADTVAKATAAGYITGYSDGMIRPNNPISRQEAAQVIMKIKKLQDNSNAISSLKDASAIPEWSKGAVGAVVTAGIMGGYPDGTFRVDNPITRAEAIVALNNALNSMSYDKAGTYGPATGTQTIEGNVTVSAEGITLQNIIIKGNLTLAKSINEGNVTLKNITVNGDTQILGGGENSIVIIDSTLGKVTVSKENGKIRIVVSGSTQVSEVVTNSGVKLQEENLTGAGFREIVIDADEDQKIILVGSFDTVNVESTGVTIDIPKGTTVANLKVDAKASITGQGTIQTADVNVSGVTFDRAPKTINLASGVTAPAVSNTSTSGGSSSGGSSTVQVSAISVSGDAVVGSTLTATTTPAEATANYQWQSADVEDGDFVDIEGSDDATYTLASEDAGKWIKVKVTGTGSYTGTVTSAAVGPILTEVTRVDNEVTQDPGSTGGTELDYSFNAATSTLTIDANNTTLPFYPQAGTTPPSGANWVGIEISVPEGVDTSAVTSTVNGEATTNLQFLGDRHFEYINVESIGDTTYTWVISWGSGYADETITIEVVNVGDLDGLTEVTRVDNEVTQDPGSTGGTELDYSFNAATSTLTIDANNTTLPFYPQAGTTPPSGANWVGIEISVPEGVDTSAVTSTVNGEATTNLQFLGDRHFEYINVESIGDTTYTWVISWGSGYADETITIEVVNVGDLDGLTEVTRVDNEVTQDPGSTGGTELDYSFNAATSTLTIDANNTTLPFYPQAGTTPPSGANWVGIEISVPEGVDTSAVTSTVNGEATTNLQFLGDRHFEYINVESIGDTTYTWVISWGSGYADETITIEVVNVGDLDGLTEVTRVDNEVTQDPGSTGGTELDYSFNAATSTLTIDANNTTLPFYPQAGTTPPSGANWVGIEISVPEGVDTSAVTSTVNGEATTNLQFLGDRHFEYINVESIGDTTYTWVISWGSGYADETITIEVVNVSNLETPDL